MNLYKRIVVLSILVVCLVSFLKLDSYAGTVLHDVNGDGELVVVLDPGHGGENLGADYGGFIEKDMNMVVANTMYEELSKYEGITVYMTRWDDVAEDISLKNRALYAQSVNADYLFCLHFNMSANNNFWGSEVWIQSKGQENRNGYAFGAVQMETMKEMGLFIRGIKTRLNDKGTDYYGILRHCKTYGISAILIEHCHVDNEHDVVFCDETDKLEAFGRADATAVAKYFGLSSSELGVDYSEYQIPLTVNSELEYVPHDITDPELCELSIVNCDYDNYQVTLSLTAKDSDSPMMYYSYSLDGGENFSEIFTWPEADMLTGYSPDSFEFTVSIEPGTTPEIVACAYNKYDRYTQSNCLNSFSEFPVIEIMLEPEDVVESEVPVMNAADELRPAEEEEDSSVIYILTVGLAIVLILLVFSMILMLMKGRKNSKNK